ncbi:MAG: V-type ATPase 116kDa subunit family protein [Clostridiaceae bacterium]
MAIQKMLFLKIVGSIEDMHDIVKKLVLCENLHVDFENTNAFDNSYIIHEYESIMTAAPVYMPEDFGAIEAECDEMEQAVSRLGSGLDMKLEIDKNSVKDIPYNLENARKDMDELVGLMGPRIMEINSKKAAIGQYEQFIEKIKCINYSNLDIDRIAELNYFDYEIGALSKENRIRLRRSYESISAIVLNIGSIKNSIEDLEIIIYPKSFKEETNQLLKSLNWVKLDIPEDIHGTVDQMIRQAHKKIEDLKNEINELSKVLETRKDETRALLKKIYTTIVLEKRILGLENEIQRGESTFVLNAWIRESDKAKIEKLLNSVNGKIIIEEKKAGEIERQVMPPTQFRNNRFFSPFETIIRLYGLPSYYEIDPTPFIAITFCLMFGIMFGDIGQGLVYFVAGLLLYKRMKAAGQILTRLGGSSIVFGFIYGSFFGLEQSELPWLPSLTGRPLDPRNIPVILIAGVVFGVAVLTVSFVFGIINSIKAGNIEAGIFGKNGLAGYIFFISLVMCGVAVTGVIGLPVIAPVSTLLVSLAAMLAKEPLANLVTNRRPLVHGSIGSYLTESIFEGVETVLGTLSNAISFIRVGAFALNHAGLFLAFLVMSEMTSNIVLKVVILLLGNVLILTLEGLVVFIQGLRLEYYEMFSKYFKGDGVEFNPVRINN